MAKIEQKNTKTKSISWSTNMVDSWMKDHAEGLFHKENPWLDGQVGVKRAGLSFEYTPDEIAELAKSADDAIYFANHYGYCLHGSQGYKPVVLRDYQEEMLRSYSDNRFTVCLSSRQSGKCSINSFINILDFDTNETVLKTIDEFYYKNLKKTYFLQKIKLFLLKLYRML